MPSETPAGLIEGEASWQEACTFCHAPTCPLSRSAWRLAHPRHLRGLLMDMRYAGEDVDITLGSCDPRREVTCDRIELSLEGCDLLLELSDCLFERDNALQNVHALKRQFPSDFDIPFEAPR